ncbi:MAG: transporter substrate-binding domain-containing protein [Kosmotogaceae bacterium]
MRKRFYIKVVLFFLIFLITTFAFGANNSQSRVIRVGVYQNKPKIFMDENGNASGIFVELLESIAKEENWTIEYVSCDWSECLNTLSDGKIQLMPDVAFSEERAEKYDFHEKPVLESWSRVYAPAESKIIDLNDLNGKRIAVLSESIQEEIFSQLMSGFGYEVTLVPANSLTQAFELARDGSADAAIANHLFGKYYYQEYGLLKTTIDFNPVKLYFATAKNSNLEILQTIDKYLDRWKSQSDSPYYSTLGRWEGDEGFSIPSYVSWIFWVLTGVLLLTIVVIFLLRYQVKIKTMRLEKSVNEKNNALEELRKSEEKYRFISEHVSDVIWMTDSNLNYTYVSPSLKDLLGYTPEEFISFSFDDVLSPRSKKYVMSIIQEEMKSIETNENKHESRRIIEFEQKRKDGFSIWVESTIVFLRDKDGNTVSILGISRDISKRKQAEEESIKQRVKLEKIVRERTAELRMKNEELGKSNLRLKEIDRLKSVFLANMSHELRTPLNSIIGFTGIILHGISGEIKPEQKKQLTMVKNSANHLLELINDVLDVSKIEAGRVDFSQENINLIDVVKEVLETASYMADKKGLKFEKEIHDDINIYSDRRRIKQILMNLVSNAIKFTDQGMVKITAMQTHDDSVEIAVIDTGIGIKKEDIKMLFKPFQQIDMSRTKKHEGTGLGLHLSKKLANLLGGDISIESEHGKGSKFILRLPLKYAKKQNDEVDKDTETNNNDEKKEGK